MATTASTNTLRHFWVLVHRYAGLAMTAFLILVGLTGSVLAFRSELDHLLNPALYVASQGRTALDPATLIENVEQALDAHAKVAGVWLGDEDAAQISVAPRNDPATGKPYALNFDQVILDPYTGKELTRRTWGAITEGWSNLIAFIYKLHYALALDQTGMWILGITAVIWTLDCFIGFYLTLPPGRRPEQKTTPSKSYWQRWQPAWQIKWKGSGFRINFDLHRASGLWLWFILFIFAWSSVYMNLWDTVYAKVTQLMFEYHEPWTELPKLDKPLEQPKLSWRQAQTLGADYLAKAAATQNFTLERPIYFQYDPELGVYTYSVRSSRDIQDKRGHTQVFIDGNSGEQRLLLLPSGQYSGNTVTSWLFALHMANVFGLPYRIFVCVLGLVIVMLAVTGVVIWLKKRRAARHRAEQHTQRLDMANQVRTLEPQSVE